MPQCNILKNHMCIRVDGTWSVCCKFMGAPRPKIKNTSFDEFRSSQSFKSVVDTMESGEWHQGCGNCKWVEERQRKESLREYANKTYTEQFGLESIEFSLSNDCNLKCRMCGPRYSNKWVRLIEENPHLIKTQAHEKYNPFDDNEVELKASEILEGVDVSKLKIIKYLGGEPFISSELIEVFKILEDRGVIGQIEFQTNTNCTLFPEKYEEWLLKFKGLVITLSIDGYGDLNDYIRDGQPWSVVEAAAVKWSRFSWRSNTNLIVTPTVQAYNIHDLHNVKKFAIGNKIRYKTQNLLRPFHYSIDALPREYLEEVRTVENNEDVDYATFNPSYWENLKKFTLDLDLAMNKSIADYIPNLYKYF